MTDTATAVVPEETSSDLPKHLGWALVLICVAQLMVVLDSTIANIALPYIRDDLHFSAGNLQWIVTGYALAFGGLLLLGGRLGDLYGRRRVFMIGVILFAVASALGGLAQNEAMLLSSRALQGVGAAIASPTALALIATTFPAGAQRNRAFSVYAMMSGVGAAIGLLLGGWLTGSTINMDSINLHGWRLTFLINVPIGLLAAFFAPRLLKESEAHKGELDIAGALTGTIGLVSLVYAVSHAGIPDPAGHTKWGAPETLAFFIASAVLLVSFVVIETRVKHPILPLRILANRTRAVAFGAMMIVPAAMFSMFYFLSQFIQTVMGYTPLQAGLAFMPFPFAMVFGAVLSSKLVAKIDPRFISGTGTLIAGIALFFFSRLSVDASTPNLYRLVHDQAGNLTQVVHVGSTVNYWTSIFPFVALMAFGMALTFIPMTLSALHEIDERDSGIGSGVLNTMQQLGGALGLAVLATVAVHEVVTRAGSLGANVGQYAQSLLPAGVHPSGSQLANIQAASQQVIGQAAFTHGATTAFVVGAAMMFGASLLIWLFLNVGHSELQADGVEPGAVTV